jgi:hypothetical protein
MAKIILKSEGKVALRESKTFERRAAAWNRRPRHHRTLRRAFSFAT